MSGNNADGESTRRSATNRRRFIQAAGAGTLTAFAGCSGQSGGSQENQGTTTGENSGSKTTLRFWNGSMTDEPANKKYWTNAIKRFNKQSNNVEVELRGVPYEGMFKKIRAGAQSGPDQMPHMAEIASRIDIMLAADNLVIDDLYEQSKLSDVIAPGIEKLGYSFGKQALGKEKLPAWPVGLRPYVPTYRKDWLKSAGVDKTEVNTEAGTLTWESDMANIFQKMKESKLGQKNGYYPSATGMKEGDEEILSHYMGQKGVSNMSMVNEAGTHAVIDTDEAREVIKWQKDWIENKEYFHKNSINFGDEEVTPRHWSGQIGEVHVQDVADLWSSYRKELGPDKYLENYTWGLPKQFKGGRKSTYAMVPVFATYKKAFQTQAEKDAMVEFVDWIAAETEQAVNRTKSIGWIPASPKPLGKDPYFEKTELHKRYWGNVKKVLEEYEFSTLPAIPNAGQINFQIPRKMHQRVMQKGMSVDKATKLAAEEINKLLKESGRYEPR